MGVSLIFKNDRGVVLNFADELVRHAQTDEFRNATPEECQGMRYGELHRHGDTKLSKVESKYVGTLYCPTMQKLLRKGWVYVKVGMAGRVRKLFSGELLLADPNKSFLHRRWKKENRCALYTTGPQGRMEPWADRP